MVAMAPTVMIMSQYPKLDETPYLSPVAIALRIIPMKFGNKKSPIPPKNMNGNPINISHFCYKSTCISSLFCSYSATLSFLACNFLAAETLAALSFFSTANFSCAYLISALAASSVATLFEII